LRSRLPELAFVEGLVGFLRLRQPAALGARPADTKGLVEAALRGFEQASTGSRAEGAKGSDRELWGIVHLEGPKAQVDLRAAHRQFAEAARLLPQSAEARNLEIISRVAAAFDGGGPAFSARATADELTLALSLDPGNASILRNLASLYRLLGGAMEAVSQPPPTTLPPISATPAPSRWTPDLPEADVRRRLEAVDAMLARRAPPR
jgi:Flp pilus assembly protein TadD